MAASTLAAATRYIRAGKTKIIVTPTVASVSGAATRAEINAGKEVANDTSAASGFSQSASSIPTPDFGSRLVTSIPGMITIPDSSLTLYASDDGADIREELVLDEECVVIWMDNGDVPGDPMDVYKCVVNSIAPTRDPSDAVVVAVSFTVREVYERVAIPA